MEGHSGEGKTHSLLTLVEAGLDLNVLVTEARGLETLLDVASDKKLDMNKIRYRRITPADVSWDAMIDAASNIHKLSFEGLSQLKPNIMQKAPYDQWLQMLRSLAKFEDERTGRNFGPVDSWDHTQALAIDSLSGLNIMSMDLIVGAKPVRSQGEWGVAMDNEERLLLKLCGSVRCFFVLTAHPERETEEIVGTRAVMAAALGQKLAPKLPRLFSEVVRAYREGDKYYWSTATPGYVLKKRNLPLSEKMEPSFVPLVKAWHDRLKIAERPNG